MSVGTLQIGRLFTGGRGSKAAFSRTAVWCLVEMGGDVPVPVEVYVTFLSAAAGRDGRGAVGSEGGREAALV